MMSAFFMVVFYGRILCVMRIRYALNVLDAATYDL